MTERLGIDFGTANTVVARWDEAGDTGVPIPLSGVELIRDAGIRQRVVPSLIAYSGTDERRWLGAQVTPAVRGTDGVQVFRSTKSAVTGRTVDLPRQVGGRRIRAAEAAADFLGDVMTLAMLETGGDPELVVTAPVESFDPYRDWLVREVNADLARLRVVDEATAAAAGYGVGLKPGDVFAVFDFGAGTLDASVVTVVESGADLTGPGVRVIAKVGLDLGGDHIDALLADAVAAECGLRDAEPAVHNRVFARLLDAAEAAKVTLGGAPTALIQAVDPVTDTVWGAEFDRSRFERLLREADVLGRIGRAFRKTLDAAAAKGHPADSLRYVFLVGGSSLLPPVRDLLATQIDPALLRLDRPLEAVAAGAAAIAGGREPVDFVQHDYAIRHVDARSGGYAFEPVVPAGTDYPTTEPVTSLTIKGIHEGQTRLGLAVYERAHATARDLGPGLEIVFDTTGGARAVTVGDQRRTELAQVWLNEEQLTFLRADPPARAGVDRFRLDFHIDAQKRLTVSAFDLERRIWVLERQPVVNLA